MAFRFKLDEPIGKAFRRIGQEQIARARRELTAAGDPDIAVHEVRKTLKRLRALLKLVRPGLSKHDFRAENTRLRDIAAGLAGARDNHVLLETVTRLQSLGPRKPGDALSTVRKLILRARDPAAPAHKPQAKLALAGLNAAKRKFQRLKLDPADFSTIERGLESAYRKARRAMAHAYAGSGGDDDAFHEWRKGIQQHWRHMALLSHIWPEHFAARIVAARALSQILGDDHDLAVLIRFARAQPSERLSPARVRDIERAARRRQRELRATAEPHGRQLFVDGAKGFARRVARLWHEAGRIERDSALRQSEDPRT